MAVENVYGDENFKRMKKLLKKRLPEKRYEHSKRVATTAEEMALIYGVDEGKARMAGLLHDWDKGLSLDEQRARVDEFGLDIDPLIITDMPYLLHGPTAAAALGAEYPELDRDVLQAIARHTSGARNMTPLDMIVYTADLIEPGRDYKRVKSIRKALGKVSLQEIYFLAFKNIYEFLIGQNRMMHPQTAQVWNHLVYQMQTNSTNRAEAAFQAGSQLEAQPTDWIAAERAMPED